MMPLRLVRLPDMKQDWFCDLCLNYGTVEVDDRASVLTILYALVHRSEAMLMLTKLAVGRRLGVVNPVLHRF